MLTDEYPMRGMVKEVFYHDADPSVTYSHERVVPATLVPPLSETISQALRDSRKITSLYTHQVAAINALGQGKNVIVSTSTASGKSVIYQVGAGHHGRLTTFIPFMCPLGSLVAIPGDGSAVDGNLHISDRGSDHLVFSQPHVMLTC